MLQGRACPARLAPQKQHSSSCRDTQSHPCCKDCSRNGPLLIIIAVAIWTGPAETCRIYYVRCAPRNHLGCLASSGYRAGAHRTNPKSDSGDSSLHAWVCWCDLLQGLPCASYGSKCPVAVVRTLKISLLAAGS